jgi:hypothetical protein
MGFLGFLAVKITFTPVPRQAGQDADQGQLSSFGLNEYVREADLKKGCPGDMSLIYRPRTFFWDQKSLGRYVPTST